MRPEYLLPFLGILLALTSCATLIPPYWFRDETQAGTVLAVLVIDHALLQTMVPHPANGVVYGAWIKAFGIIYISDRLNASERECAESHERKHAAGWDHVRDWLPNRMICE